MKSINDETRRWSTLATAAGVFSLIVLDLAMAGVALPTIRKDLHMTQVASYWVINAYLLLFSLCVSAGAKLRDILGHRVLLLIGVAVFSMGSYQAGFAQTGSAIILARAVQGLGAAVLFPTSIALLTDAFPEDRGGIAPAIQSAAAGILLALGPICGGFFTQVWTWRWVFWINLPVLALTAFIALVVWEEPERDCTSTPANTFDIRGLLTLVFGVGAMVLATTRAAGWRLSSILLSSVFVLGAIMFAIFLRTEQRAPTPLLRIDLLRTPAIAATNLVTFVGQWSLISVVIFAPLYFRQVLNLSPLATGFALLFAVGPLPFSFVLAHRINSRLLTLSSLLVNGAAIAWLAVVAQSHGQALPATPLILWGCSFPFLYLPTRPAMTGRATADQRGEAANIRFSARAFGATAGMTVSGFCLARSGNFATVYAVTVGVMFLVLLISLFALHPEDPG